MSTHFESELNEFLESIPEELFRILEAAIIVVCGILLLKLGRHLIERGFRKYFRRHEETTRMQTMHKLVLSIFNAAMIFAIAFAALDTMGVDVKGLLTVAGFSGFALVFGCQTLIKDVISGMFLWAENSCNVGDTVTVAGQTGVIENVALRTTTLRGADGAVYVIPNGEIRTVINMTSDYRCAIVDIPVSVGSDYELALDVLRKAMAKVNDELDYIDENPVVKGYIAMDRGAATCRIECRCSVDRCRELERVIRLRAMEALAAAEIKP